MDCAIGILAIHIYLQHHLRGGVMGNFHIARTFRVISWRGDSEGHVAVAELLRAPPRNVELFTTPLKSIS